MANFYKFFLCVLKTSLKTDCGDVCSPFIAEIAMITEQDAVVAIIHPCPIRSAWSLYKVNCQQLMIVVIQS